GRGRCRPLVLELVREPDRRRFRARRSAHSRPPRDPRCASARQRHRCAVGSNGGTGAAGRGSEDRVSAVWMRFRAELRARWLAWLGLALLVGLVGGTAIAAAAGARRTESAYPRFVDSQEGYDVGFGGTGGNRDIRAESDAIAALPQV